MRKHHLHEGFVVVADLLDVHVELGVDKRLDGTANIDSTFILLFCDEEEEEFRLIYQ